MARFFVLLLHNTDNYQRIALRKTLASPPQIITLAEQKNRQRHLCKGFPDGRKIPASGYGFWHIRRFTVVNSSHSTQDQS